ncbi:MULTISPECIES: ribonuclease I [unclassified Acinetobacter]|uniref:ribonuclease I n=1 Tax=unclassified Acinetobacter TaxID=196816 RepID=UPI0035B7BD58
MKMWLFSTFTQGSYLAAATVVTCALASKAHAAPTGFVLDIEMSPATCRLNPQQNRTRQCLEGYSLSVIGLLPDGVNPRQCETSNSFYLTPVQKRLLMRIMPDENAQVRLWRSVGGCVEMNASQYFRTMVTYADSLNIPSEVTTPNTIRVYRDGLQRRFMQLNPNMPAQSVQFSCQNQRNGTPVLTQVRVCYNAGGRYQACRVERMSNSCGAQMVVQGSY